MHNGKCPGCKNTGHRMFCQPVPLAVRGGHVDMTYDGLVITCSSCNTILGVTVNPLTIRDEIIGYIATNSD